MKQEGNENQSALISLIDVMEMIKDLDTVGDSELKAPNVELDPQAKKQAIIQFLMAVLWAVGGT